MIKLIRAELRKLFTTKLWLWLLLGACVLAGGSAALLIGFADQAAATPQSGIPAVEDPAFTQLALAAGANGVVFLLILGIIGMTQEYRHRTATPTFLVTPKRGQVVLAKLLTYLGVSLLFGLVVNAVVLAVALPWLGAKGAEVDLSGENLEVLLSSIGGAALYGLVGVGVGALLRNQVAAIVGSLVYLFVVEPILRSVPATASAYKWLPGGALESITATVGETDLLQRWQGALLLAAYGIVLAVLGWVFAVRRDVS
ncbi:MAG: ABC transporter permease [Actinomycetota bacterium]|nr:ABC transporter permease [Actinomycetota bacterium]